MEKESLSVVMAAGYLFEKWTHLAHLAWCHPQNQFQVQHKDQGDCRTEQSSIFFSFSWIFWIFFPHPTSAGSPPHFLMRWRWHQWAERPHFLFQNLNYHWSHPCWIVVSLQKYNRIMWSQLRLSAEWLTQLVPHPPCTSSVPDFRPRGFGSPTFADGGRRSLRNKCYKFLFGHGKKKTGRGKITQIYSIWHKDIIQNEKFHVGMSILQRTGPKGSTILLSQALHSTPPPAGIGCKIGKATLVMIIWW